MPSTTNVKQAYALVNGVKVPAIYDETTGLWSIETTAPSESSWSQPDHVYQISLHAEDLAGNTVSMDSSDETYGDELKIRVLEKTAPVVRIVTPTQDAVLGSSTQTIELEMYDLGGSGLNMNSVVFKVNDVAVSNSELTWTENEEEKMVASYEATGLDDGANKVEFTVTDNDGNTAQNAVVNFIISTVAPLLTVITPEDGLITNDAVLSVTGKAAPGTEYTTLEEVTVNGALATLGEPDTDGYVPFTITIPLVAGDNTIKVIAKDSAEKTTSVTRTVTLDTESPIITDVHAVATTVDANGIIKITFRVTDQ